MSDRPVITAFDWVPDFAKGQVRDLRVRWALEELGQPYAVEKFGAATARPEHYVDWQPFEQVPAYRDGKVDLFESGAILLYLAEKHGALLPADAQARWQAIAWTFAALNSVEPVFLRHIVYTVFHADKPWSAGAREAVDPLVRQKLSRVDNALGEKHWLAGEFSIADIMMVTVLGMLRQTDFVAGFPRLAEYLQRGMARTGYQRALAAQCDDFDGPPPPSQGG